MDPHTSNASNGGNETHDSEDDIVSNEKGEIEESEDDIVSDEEGVIDYSEDDIVSNKESEIYDYEDDDITAREATEAAEKALEEAAQWRSTARRGSAALLKIDKRHNWLVELDENLSPETTSVSIVQYVALSNHFKEYLEELKSDDSMIEVRVEFSQLFEKFRCTYAQSQRYLKKIEKWEEWYAMLEEENADLQLQLKEKLPVHHIKETDESLSSVEEQSSKQSLGGHLEDETSAKGKSKRQTIVSIPEDEDEKYERILMLEEELEDLRDEVKLLQERESTYQEKLEKAKKTKTSLQNDLAATKKALQKQDTKLVEAGKIIANNEDEIMQKNSANKLLSKKLDECKSKLASVEEKSKSLLKDLRKCKKDLDNSTQIITKLKRDINIREDRIAALTDEKKSMNFEIDTKQKEIFDLKSDLDNMTRERNEFYRQISLQEERLEKMERTVENLKMQNRSQSHEMEITRKDLNKAENKIFSQEKEKNNLVDEIQKNEHTITDLRAQLKNNENQLQYLEKEVETTTAHVTYLQDIIKGMERVKDNLNREIRDLKHTIIRNQNEITRLELAVSEMKKVESQLKQELDAEMERYKVVAEEIRFSKKQATEAKLQVEQMTEHQLMLNNYMQQLKNRNKEFDEECKKLKLKNKTLVEQVGSFKEQYKQEKKIVIEHEEKLKCKDQEEQQSLRKLSNLDQEVKNLERKIRNLSEEKDVLLTKIIDKDHYIQECNERIILMQNDASLLDKTISEREIEIKNLKHKIAELEKECKAKSQELESLEATRNELADISDRLEKEQFKTKTLEEEVEKPINLHRWRILEGKDPTRAELIEKNQFLQKQLVKKRAELENKEADLLETENVTQNLREALKRRSEIGLDEQLLICRRELKARMESLKCLTFENNMFKSLHQKYESENMGLREALKKYKLAEFADNK